MTTERLCPGCTRQIPYEARYNTYCSKKCWAKNKKPNRVLTFRCAFCNNLMHKIKGKRCCSHGCHHELRHKEYVERWLSGHENGNQKNELVSDHVKRWLKETRGDRCEECKWDTPHPVLGYVQLNVDHIDGNASRTIPKNLRLLCLRCHGMTPTYGGLNRGNGLKSRYNKSNAPVS